jgi:hypothetical protein
LFQAGLENIIADAMVDQYRHHQAAVALAGRLRDEHATLKRHRLEPTPSAPHSVSSEDNKDDDDDDDDEDQLRP